MIDKAKEMIIKEEFSCVVVKNDEILHMVEGNGIRPLLELYIKHKEDLKDAYIADKVIGKAAATIVANAGAKRVYAHLMSKSAEALLEKYHIEYEFKNETEKIYNMDKTDLCPLEKTVLPYSDKKEAIEALFKFFEDKKK
jgi:hypothetical protein